MMTPAALMSLLLVGALAHHQSQWSYSVGPLDQNHWPWEYPACGGERQSPINVQRNKVQYNPSLKALNLTGYDAKGRQFPMTNTGSTVQIGLPSTMRMTASDGTEYVAKQMHFHWGGAFPDISGSEHTIDGLRYAAEVHVVHYNSKYNSFEKAKSAPDGLAVLAALVEVKDYTENMYYDDFFYHLRTIKYKGQNIILKGLDVQGMLPNNLDSYYTYQGSLSTPPCTQNVQWFLLADKVPFSRAQIEALQDSLLDVENRVIRNNYRSVQPLNTNRVVESNFVHQPDPKCF